MLDSLLIRRALPLLVSFTMLVVLALLIDYFLHVAGLVWVGRYLGITGTFFLLFSFVYSARKQKIVHSGPIKTFLMLHCRGGWIGTLMLLVHSGVHFNALLPWAATALMLIVTGSGHVGQYIYKKTRETLLGFPDRQGTRTVAKGAHAACFPLFGACSAAYTVDFLFVELAIGRHETLLCFFSDFQPADCCGPSLARIADQSGRTFGRT